MDELEDVGSASPAVSCDSFTIADFLLAAACAKYLI